MSLPAKLEMQCSESSRLWVHLNSLGEPGPDSVPVLLQLPAKESKLLLLKGKSLCIGEYVLHIPAKREELSFFTVLKFQENVSFKLRREGSGEQVL